MAGSNVLMFPLQRANTTKNILKRLTVVESFAGIADDGLPAYFIRLAGCNFDCGWCDVKYSYGSGLEKNGVKVLTVDNVWKEVANSLRVILTGGEPMLYLHQNNPVLINLLRSFDDHEVLVEVETNGSALPRGAFDSLISYYYVSPKLSNSGTQFTGLYKQAMEHFAFLMDEDRRSFKFVIRMDAFKKDIKEFKKFCKMFELDRRHVSLMAEGTQFDPDLLAYCKEEGYGYTPRLSAP